MTLPAVLRKFIGACAEAGEMEVSHGTLKRARKLAIVVGSLLVVINQWEAITGSSAIDWVTVLLTSIVLLIWSRPTPASASARTCKFAARQNSRKSLSVKRRTSLSEKYPPKATPEGLFTCAARQTKGPRRSP